MDLAVYDLKLHRGRFIATVLGVGLLFTIVLAMNGLYRGNIHEGLALIKATNPDLWVVERYRGGPFNEQSTLPEFYHYSVKAMPGVEKASPFIYYTVERPIGNKSQQFSIIGFDIFGGLEDRRRFMPEGISSKLIMKWSLIRNWVRALGIESHWVSISIRLLV